MRSIVISLMLFSAVAAAQLPTSNGGTGTSALPSSGQILIGQGGAGNPFAPETPSGACTITSAGVFTCSHASTTNALTMNNSGSGAASGATFNGSTAVTLSYNTLGAAPTASPTFTGTTTFPDGTTDASGGWTFANHQVLFSNGSATAININASLAQITGPTASGLGIGATGGNLSLNSSSGTVNIGGAAFSFIDTNTNYMESSTANTNGVGWDISDNSSHLYIFPSALGSYPAGAYFFPVSSTGFGIIDPSSGFQTVFNTAAPTAATTLVIPAVSGSVELGVIPTASTGHAICETTIHTLGHCTTVVSATGTCTCT